ncbi:hypothetical protein [Telluribacter sp. SYSU D00476]|uniref:hypothetical protein n=1 Tax=Telluribacter sp. SYSU D00476 TaxID=2811430 RepID=UPI001FF500EE|nr:hypothetical protein [Telluribacter sp. SYSU D00476]
MKKFCYTLFSVLSVSFFAHNAIAQNDNNTANHNVAITIPEVALLDIETSASRNITLQAKHSTEAGDPISFEGVTNSDLWLNYSSIVSTANVSRKITAQLTGSVPAGVQLKVVAGNSVSGGGTRGTSVANGVTLTSTPQDLVTGIGSSYTDNGPEKGHQLTYSLSLVDASSYGDLRFDQSNQVEVTYTIINQ